MTGLYLFVRFTLPFIIIRAHRSTCYNAERCCFQLTFKQVFMSTVERTGVHVSHDDKECCRAWKEPYYGSCMQARLWVIFVDAY